MCKGDLLLFTGKIHHMGLGIRGKIGWKALNKMKPWMTHQDPRALESARNWDCSPWSTWREPTNILGPVPAKLKVPHATLLKIINPIMHELAYKIQSAALCRLIWLHWTTCCEVTFKQLCIEQSHILWMNFRSVSQMQFRKSLNSNWRILSVR